MKILHLFADWKWTGPAEPVSMMCSNLSKSGVDVTLAVQPAPEKGKGGLIERLSSPAFELMTDFSLSKGFKPIKSVKDIGKIRRFIESRKFDIVHCHTDHDHFVGGMAARKAGAAKIVRTNHKGAPFRDNIAARYLMRSLTDAYTSFTESGLAQDKANFPEFSCWFYKLNPSIDLDVFNADKVKTDARKELGIPDGAPVAGIVARVQSHRRFDVLLEAFKKALHYAPELRLIIVGRGTRIKELAIEPAKKMGLGERVIFPGYRSGDYAQVINTFDFNIFLVPGSDGTCRAVREAMAIGKPVIAARRGMLPELVEHNRTGLVVDDTPDKLAKAIVMLASEPGKRAEYGRAAMKKARAEFNPAVQTKQILKVYKGLLAGRNHD